jgi:translation initiation factor IF-2
VSDSTDQDKRPLSLGRTGGKLELRKPIETGQVRQSFPHGRTKTVQVEVRKKRVVGPGGDKPAETPAVAATAAPATAKPAAPARRPVVLPQGLTEEERAHRVRALKGAIADAETRRQADADREREREETARIAAEEARRVEEENKKKAVEEDSKKKTDDTDKRKLDDDRRKA